MEDNHGNTFTYLQPYIHQVGGHSSMLCLDETTVCKPAVQRELQFYENLPKELRPFAPEYFGIVEVNVLTDGEFISLIGSVPKSYTLQYSSNIKRLRWRRSGSLDHGMCGAPVFEEDTHENGKDLTSNRVIGMNPWVFKCHREHLVTLATSMEANKTPQNFLLLENLTKKFKFPCILDLKMGTRQYDDSDSLTKRQSKMVKVVSTTSGKLGVRVGGMQVYQVTTGRFLCRNKFYGRSLTSVGFGMALRHFLHNGERLRWEVLPPLIRQLEALSDTVGQLNSLRLYTTSLLLLYEGEPLVIPPETDRLREKRESFERIRANSVEECDNANEVKESEGLERSNSAGSLTSLNEEAPDVRRSSCLSFSRRRRSYSCHPTSRRLSQSGDVKEEEPCTDVRIIDFAHSTHCGLSDSVVYSGPDQGFLFGLENMINILKSIDSDFVL